MLFSLASSLIIDKVSELALVSRKGRFEIGEENATATWSGSTIATSSTNNPTMNMDTTLVAAILLERRDIFPPKRVYSRLVCIKREE